MQAISEQGYLPAIERLSRLFQHLEIDSVHVIGAGGLEAAALADAIPARIASLTFVCPPRFTPEPERLDFLAARLLLIHGDCGPASPVVPDALPALPRARTVLLEGYVDALWADPVADRTSEIGQAMLAFLADASCDDPIAPLEAGDEHGEVAGIFYRAQGSGPPLLLFPLNLAPSQWEPLLPLLSQHYRTITLGGAYLWGVAQLEQRMRSGYGSVVRSLVETCALQRGERILDVGCGSGGVARWLARQTCGANPIIGIDLNPYLLREAADLATGEGVADFIQFQQGNAEALPFPADSFDVTLACTVLEEGDAERMLAELVRVTKPGGRVGVVVRAEDVPVWDSLELPAHIRAKVETRPGYGAETSGCADTSLYRRVRALGLDALTMGPQLGTFSADPQLESVLSTFESSQLAALDAEEAQAWRAIAAQAMEKGTYLWTSPFHCAVGVKPRQLATGASRGYGRSR